MLKILFATYKKERKLSFLLGSITEQKRKTKKKKSEASLAFS